MQEHNTLTWPDLKPEPLNLESSAWTTRLPNLPWRMMMMMMMMNCTGTDIESLIAFLV